MKKIKIALIAHDGMKADMVSFVTKRLDFFNREDIEICATGTTGKFLSYAGITKVEALLSGPKGGDAQIASMVASGKIDAVIFFRDPLDSHPHEPDIQMLMRVCDVHVVPLATNYISAKLIIDWFRIKENVEYWKNKNKGELSPMAKGPTC
jgi:methylglyoxal synthase